MPFIVRIEVMLRRLIVDKVKQTKLAPARESPHQDHTVPSFESPTLVVA